MHYKSKLIVLKTLNSICEDETLVSAGMLPKIIWELLICSIFCPPGLDQTFESGSRGGSSIMR